MRRVLVAAGLCAVIAGCGSSSDGDGGGGGAPAAARDASVQTAAAPGADHGDRDRDRAADGGDRRADGSDRRTDGSDRRTDGSDRRTGGNGKRAAGDGPGDGGVLRGTYTRLNGVRTDLAGYRGDVVLVVNTATACGFTPQFEGLEALYRERRAEGLVVLGFPANDFAGQEPRSDDEIATFCQANYGVTFPLFAKTHVVGGAANPLFRALTEAAGAPEWNFNKYLVDRAGKVVARFGSGTEPDGPELRERLDAML